MELPKKLKELYTHAFPLPSSRDNSLIYWPCPHPRSTTLFMPKLFITSPSFWLKGLSARWWQDWPTHIPFSMIWQPAKIISCDFDLIPKSFDVTSLEWLGGSLKLPGLQWVALNKMPKQVAVQPSCGNKGKCQECQYANYNILLTHQHKSHDLFTKY